MNYDSYKYIRYNASQETRWATIDEIENSTAKIDLLEDDYPAAGLPIMSDGKTAYVDNADTHSLIFGATGSKKTRLFCMPMINMMTKAGESFIVTDPKGELYAQTSGLAKEKGYNLVVLNFRDLGFGDMWNPLSLPYEMWCQGKKDEAGMLLNDITSSIAGPITSNSKDAYWPEAAQELAIACLYTLMESAKPDEINMKSFAKISSFGEVENIKNLCDMMSEDSIPYINFKSTVCIDAKVTASGIVASLFGMLRMFSMNEKLTKMLSKTTFNMRNIGKEKTAVYIIVPDEKTTYHFLITMFIKQAYEILISEAQKEKDRKLPVRVNFVLDEFCNIPQVPDMPSMISAARSRNMRYFLVVQSIHQLKGRYGEDADTIKGNCDNWVFLTSKELDLLNEISELCGNIITPDGQCRSLISTSELQRFSKEKGEALIMHARQYPIISELPDISDYEMFGNSQPIEMQSQEEIELKCMSLTSILNKIRELELIAPFASEEHILSQAQRIYRDERSNAETDIMSQEEDCDRETPKGSSISDMFERMRRSRMSDSDEDDDEVSSLDESIDELFRQLDEDKDDDASEDDEDAIEKERLAQEAAKKAQEERKQKVLEIAKERSIARISSLISPEYAKRFFDEKLYEVRLARRHSFDY